MGQLFFVSNPKKYKLDGQYNLRNQQLAQGNNPNQQQHVYQPADIVYNQAEELAPEEDVPDINHSLVYEQAVVQNLDFLESISSQNSVQQEYWHSAIIQSILKTYQDQQVDINRKEMLADCFIVALQLGRFQQQMNDHQWISHLNTILFSIQALELEYYAKLHLISEFINDFGQDVLQSLQQFNNLIETYSIHHQQIMINNFPIDQLFITIESQQNNFQNQEINPIEDLLQVFALGVECGRKAQVHLNSGKELISTLLDLVQQFSVLKNIVQYQNPPQNLRNIMNQLINELIQMRTSQLNILLNRVCPICLEKIDYSNLIKIESCQHSFHKKCLGDHVDSTLQNSANQIKCPEVCSQFLTMTEIQLLFHKGKVRTVQEKLNKQLFQQNPQLFSTCPTANCDYTFIFEGDDNFNFLCPNCLRSYCLKCRVKYHANMTCQQFRQSGQYLKRLAQQKKQDKQFQEFVRGQNFKQCPKCTIWVERISGCLHMTCHCKYEFCYRCGGTYRNCPCGG